MAGRIFLANVGANASHRFASPIFEDGTFEFLPIPEDRPLPDPHAVRYRALASYYDREESLARFVPDRLLDWTTHNDPEFDTFTYGDNCGTTPRAAALKGMEAGDFLFFIARMRHWRANGPTGSYGFYLVGYLEIGEVLRDVVSHPDTATLRRFAANAHVRRGLSDARLWDGFWAFAGSPASRRFKTAVPVTRELADRAFAAADGSPWQWDGGRTELQVIGSYTRSCRCIVDPRVDGHGDRAQALWDWVDRHASERGSTSPSVNRI